MRIPNQCAESNRPIQKIKSNISCNINCCQKCIIFRLFLGDTDCVSKIILSCTWRPFSSSAIEGARGAAPGSSAPAAAWPWSPPQDGSSSATSRRDELEDPEDAAKKQSVIDLEELYVWLQQFEDPSLGEAATSPAGGRHSPLFP